ncbi:MAG: cob(I)yrinic acid a,c-diamide adenosyltransferase [Candidatus Micrarchaeia archaeon]
MPVYTKRGDGGKTSLLDGKEVYKDDLAVEAYGTIDELNAILGLVRCKIDEMQIKKQIEEIQKELFIMGVELSGGKNYKKITQIEIKRLEEWIDGYEKEMPPLNHFIIPGKTIGSSILHFARTVSRRAERRVSTLSKKERIRKEIPAYLNRLSDFLFVCARWANYKKRIDEAEWKGKKLI